MGSNKKRVLDIYEEIVDKVIFKIYSYNENVHTITPGISDRHYSLQTAIYLAENLDELISKYHKKKISLLVVIKRIGHRNIAHQEVLSVAGDYPEAANNLFTAMDHFDILNLDIFMSERLTGVSTGNSINNRLIRATI